MLARLSIVAGLVLGVAAAGLLLGGLIALAPEAARPSLPLPSASLAPPEPSASVEPSATAQPSATATPLPVASPDASTDPSATLPEALTDVGRLLRVDVAP